MSARLYKLIILLILLFAHSSHAKNEDSCVISNDSLLKNLSGVSVYSIAEMNIFCSTDLDKAVSSENLFLKKDLKVIRGHLGELGSLKALTSSHGYHLVHGPVDCQAIHCDHINVLNLDQFNSIQTSKFSGFNLSGSITVQTAVNEISPTLWLSDIGILSSWSRQSGTAGNNSAATWIESRFNAHGLDVSTQSFEVSGQVTNNIIGVQAGNTTPDEWYVMGAHMDSIPTFSIAPGAVDNASGCAGVLELARVASKYTFDSSIIFICYSGEEQGLIGSQFHVESIIANGDQSKVKAALTMDMIGYTSNTDHELLLETSSSNQWLMDVLAQNAAIYAPGLTVHTSTNPFGSDHVPYINNDMHGILSIDDDWNVYPAYHQSTDLPENINLAQGEYILRTNFAALAQLAELNGVSDIIFINGFE